MKAFGVVGRRKPAGWLGGARLGVGASGASLRDRGRALRDRLTDLFARAAADGSARADLDPATLAAETAAFLEGVHLLWLLDPDRVDLVAVPAATSRGWPPGWILAATRRGGIPPVEARAAGRAPGAAVAPAGVVVARRPGSGGAAMRWCAREGTGGSGCLGSGWKAHPGATRRDPGAVAALISDFLGEGPANLRSWSLASTVGPQHLVVTPM
ncbi:TetR family transcriptional regulator C-terminal domain-containing protein [Nonomuraea indica]|uniref:TetR family transcriptional regulator C-terminal domain-containing protein n=1 Tax=Nonomuraea indica TaxID=1581193 RepID=A0ABW8A0X2_9ACTN